MVKYIYEVNCPALGEDRMRTILKELSTKYGVTAWKVKSNSQSYDLVKVRVEFSRRCIEFANRSEIARYLNRHPSTIFHYINHWND